MKKLMRAFSFFPLCLMVVLTASAEIVATSPLVGEITVSGVAAPWQVRAMRVSTSECVETIRVSLGCDAAAQPPSFKVSFACPLKDTVGHWRSGARFNKFITQNWRGEARWSSSLASQGPVIAFYNGESRNRFTIACSESLRKVEFCTGISEHRDGDLEYNATFFTDHEAPLNDYTVEFRIDARDVFYAEAVRDAFDWCVNALGGSEPVEASAFDPLYSFWYSYHQNVKAEAVERECAHAVGYGMKTIIVDDGWQTDDNNGGYAYCGDWQVSTNRFPDFVAHVENVHRLGLKYMLWYSVPFVGEKSVNFTRFKGKYLYHDGGLGASVLDPRFPDVREFLVDLYAHALAEWKLDGFKLDFIDSFCFRGSDPALVEDYAGRDIKSLPLAVDRLMTDVTARLKGINPKVLLEFRQSYVGPAIRKYGNMMRVGDCAYGVAQNRTGSLDLRLSSGPLAVHSDMIVWNQDVPPETAALQFCNVLFAVPQISVRLDSLPQTHRTMLKNWLDFWLAHRETLMFGDLRPMRPDLNYPIVYAYGKGEQVIAVYDADQVVRIDSTKGRAFIVNATGARELTIEKNGVLFKHFIAPSSVVEFR